MDTRFTYTDLTIADKEYLYIILDRRWKAVRKRFMMSGLLPLAGILIMLFIANLVIIVNIDKERNVKGINIPPGIEHFSLLWMAVPIFSIFVFINFVMFLQSIPPLYYDIQKGKKKQLVFMPHPYTLPGSGSYYINTGLPALRFIEVSYEQYIAADYSQPCYLEVAPRSNIPLGIKTISGDAEIMISQHN